MNTVNDDAKGSENEANPAGLSEEDLLILKKLETAAARQNLIPENERVWLTSDKFAGAPGFRDDGTPMDGRATRALFEQWRKENEAAAAKKASEPLELTSAELCVLYAALDLDVAPLVQSSELLDLETDALEFVLVAARRSLIERGLAHTRADGSLEVATELHAQVQQLAAPKILVELMHTHQNAPAQRVQFALDGTAVITHAMRDKVSHALSHQKNTSALATDIIQLSQLLDLPAVAPQTRLPTFALPHPVLAAAMADPNSRLADIVTQLAAAGLDKAAAQSFVAAGLVPTQQTVLQATSRQSSQARLLMWFADGATSWLIANLDEGGSVIVQQASAEIIEQAIHRFMAAVLDVMRKRA